MLDYYGVPWSYEPRTFVLEEDEEGRVVEAFTPDFYLPEQDLYLEITVMKQSLVTRKNRKLRKLRERYPDVKVKLFYKRDIERLAQRFRLDSGVTGSPTTGRRGLSLGRRDRHARARARRRDRRATTRPGAAARRAPEGELRLPRRPLAGDPDPSRARLRRARRLRQRGRPAATRGSGCSRTSTPTSRPRRAARRGRRRHGLTLNYLCKQLELREPGEPARRRRCSTGRTAVSSTTSRSRYVGFTVPDEFFVGYGFDLDERWRKLPDLHLVAHV